MPAQATLAAKPWTLSWSLMGVWMVECGRQGDGYGRHSGHLTFASEDKAIARKVAGADDMLAALKRNRAALDLIDPMRPLQYATTMDLMRKDMDAAIATATRP